MNSDTPIVSIIICTRSRASDLAQTLVALGSVCVPADLPCELVIVDNGSTDSTAQVAQGCVLPNMPVRYVREARAGKGYAYNTGLASAQGQIMLLTDDDVRPPADWVAGMCRPILTGEADAVAGGIHIAPHLLRDWMTDVHRAWLASTEGLTADAETVELIGANMAFAKMVLGKVPEFDTELGPGALGFMDETLFSRQLARAGYRIIARPEIAVTHHFDPSRLSRAAFLATARARGRSMAYVDWHWAHRDIRAVRLRLWRQIVSLWVRRGRAGRAVEVPEWEMNGEQFAHYFRAYLTERRRPRQYARFGLVKNAHE